MKIRIIILFMYLNNKLGLRPIPHRLMSSGEDAEALKVQQAAMSFTLALIFVMLVIGQIFKQLSIKTGVPYTPMITVFCMVIEIINLKFLKEDYEDSYACGGGQPHDVHVEHMR